MGDDTSSRSANLYRTVPRSLPAPPIPLFSTKLEESGKHFVSPLQIPHKYQAEISPLMRGHGPLSNACIAEFLHLSSEKAGVPIFDSQDWHMNLDAVIYSEKTVCLAHHA